MKRPPRITAGGVFDRAKQPNRSEHTPVETTLSVREKAPPFLRDPALTGPIPPFGGASSSAGYAVAAEEETGRLSHHRQ